MRNRVVVTGLGVLSACGIGWKPLWEACLEGRSCIRPATRPQFKTFPLKNTGEVPDFDPKKFVQNRKNIKLMSRDIQFAVAAAKLAFEDAGLVPSALDPSRAGTVVGSAVINNELEELSAAYMKAAEADGSFSLKKFGAESVPALFPLWMLKYLPNMPAGHITIEFGLRGYSNTVTFSAASGAQAIGEAARVIERGDADVMAAGGTDSKLNPMGLSRMHLLGMLSKSGEQRSLKEDADGLVPGEGAGILILESLEHAQKRGAKIYAEITGFGSASDANLAPDRHSDAAGKERAMKSALRDAKISAADLDGLIANGAGLKDHDRTESEALKKVVQNGTVISALKPVTGHTVYAAGGIEAAVAALAVKEDKFPAASKPMRHVMLNSFGFCGQNAALVFKKVSP